jgi:hypothetical protein
MIWPNVPEAAMRPMTPRCRVILGFGGEDNRQALWALGPAGS